MRLPSKRVRDYFSFADRVMPGEEATRVSGDLSGKNVVQNSDGSKDGRVIWGYYSVTIDPSTGAVAIVPERGLMMHLNAVEWMQPPHGSIANLGVVVVDSSEYLTKGRLDVNVTLKHPFPGATTYTGFDVMGLFMTRGHKALASQAGATFNDGGINDATMLNPDSYTRWWNQGEFADQTISIFSYIPGKRMRLRD